MLYTGIQKLSLVDFDTEVSTTIFTGGCNFRCPFCHNFEFVVFDKDTLETIKDEDIYNYLLNRKKFLTAVVITGGEPTINKDLKDAIIKIKEMGYKIKLDTNGTNPDLVIDLLENNLIDYVAIDIKNSKEMYNETVGLTNLNIKPIEKIVDYLINHNYDYEFRTTLINNYHSIESITSMGKWLNGAKKLFLQKFVMSDNVPNKELKEVTKEDATKFMNILSKTIENVSLRGY